MDGAQRGACDDGDDGDPVGRREVDTVGKTMVKRLRTMAMRAADAREVAALIMRGRYREAALRVTDRLVEPGPGRA